MTLRLYGAGWTIATSGVEPITSVTVPGLSVAEGNLLAAEERERGRKQRGPVIRHPRRRLSYLDLSGVVGAERVGEVLRLETAFVKDRVVKKPPPVDPDVLG